METLLIVDDEKNYPPILSAVLEEEGFETLTANSGQEAMDILKHADVDLILTDMKMPKMDGIELLEHVKTQDPELPVIFDSIEARYRFAPWFGDPANSREAAEFLERPARFLTAMGEIHADLGNLERALGLYAAAWAMNTANLDAGLYAANLLLEYSDTLDPEGRYLRRFISLQAKPRCDAAGSSSNRAKLFPSRC